MLKRVEEIELLRAVAIIFTLFQHLGMLLMPSKDAWIFVNINNPYWGGVDLFFCISGFVISKRMFRSWNDLTLKEHWLETWRFWVRRFFRIAPTLLLWVGIWLLATVYFNKSGGFGPLDPNIKDSIAAIFNFSNFHIFECVIGKSSCGPNPVYWSLSLEEQFYFALPILLLLPRKTFIWTISLLVLIQLPLHRMPWEQTLGGALWFFRTDAILAGVLLAYFSTTNTYVKLSKVIESKYKRRTIFSFTLIILLSAIPRSGFYFSAGGIALTSAALVLLASFDKGFLFRKTRLTIPFLWIGSRSFSIYLLHFPIYYLINEVAFRASGLNIEFQAPITHNEFNLALAAGTFVGIFIIAELNYRIIETPMRKFGRRFGEKQKDSVNAFQTN